MFGFRVYGSNSDFSALSLGFRVQHGSGFSVAFLVASEFQSMSFRVLCLGLALGDTSTLRV